MGNCEKMNDYFNVAWEINDEDITIELIGALDGDEGYMSFGLSGSNSRSSMYNADVIVGYYSDRPKVVDHILTGYSLCANGVGACPDIESEGSEDWRIVHAEKAEGMTKIKARRKRVTGDSKDIAYSADGDTYIVWAMGRLNDMEMVTKHDLRLQGNKQIHFGRLATRNCPVVTKRESENLTPWEPATLSGESNKAFTVQIGPAGGQRGYTPITGQQSWGIAWYINNLLIPEIYVKRNETYTFTIEGGNDQSNSAEYHPFYITNDPVGGYSQKTDQEKSGIAVYAGPKEGRYCEWKHKTVDMSKESEKFEEYFKTLMLDCKPGEAGTLTWTPGDNTPDIVYYQCWTHNYLGWKIHVVDEYSSDAPCFKSSLLMTLTFIALILVLDC